MCVILRCFISPSQFPFLSSFNKRRLAAARKSSAGATAQKLLPFPATSEACRRSTAKEAQPPLETFTFWPTTRKFLHYSHWVTQAQFLSNLITIRDVLSRKTKATKAPEMRNLQNPSFHFSVNNVFLVKMDRLKVII